MEGLGEEQDRLQNNSGPYPKIRGTFAGDRGPIKKWISGFMGFSGGWEGGQI